MNYAEIKPLDIANGEGVRVSLFVSGCRNHCPGCFNACTWDFAYGRPFDKHVEDRILALLSPAYVHGLTLLGGEPFEKENQRALLPFLKRVKDDYPTKTIWAYTGCLLERDLLSPTGRVHCEATIPILKLLDVLVDGPYIEAKKNISLQFRGSENQRILSKSEILSLIDKELSENSSLVKHHD